MELFDHKNYKEFVRAWVESRPGGGRGLFRKIAEHLKVSSVLVSQIFRGERDLSLEQAYALSSFLELSELQARYFLLLVEHARAGTFGLKAHYEKQLEEIRALSRNLKHRLPPDKQLSIEEAAVFYSHWLYSAVRVATSIEGLQDAASLAKYFRLPKSRIQSALDFLVQNGLCAHEGHRYQMGARSTHLPLGSPLLPKMHANWRLKGMEEMSDIGDGELFYSSSVSLGKEDIPLVRKMVVEMIENFSKRVKDAPCETVACLNIDWFELG